MNYTTKRMDVRGLQYHVHQWGDSSNPALFMLHGWMDCGATYKFIAPKLVDKFHIVAPDLRGFGDTEHLANGYYFPEYFADLNVILDHYSPQTPVNLVGHSMGGQIALMYAGIQPQRVAKLLSLEAIGLPASEPSQAPHKYREWMTQILSDEPAKVYPHADSLKHSIYKGNPSLSVEMIEQLAILWGKPVGDDGAVMLKHDHAHRYTNPVRYSYQDAVEVWKEITARVGLVMAKESWMYRQFGEMGRIDEAKQILKIAEHDYFVVEDSHHMLHLEQPEATAECVLRFFS